MKKIIASILFLILLFCGVFAVTDWNRAVRDGVATETKMMLKTGADSGTTSALATGNVTANASFMIIDTEGDAATDVLVTMNAGLENGRYDQVRNGDIVMLKCELASQDITIVSSGNISLGRYGDLTLDTVDDYVSVHYDETQSNWRVVDTNLDGGLPISTVDINGGAIDGAIIGASSAAAGTFTTMTCTTGNITSYANIDGGVIDGTVIGGASALAGTFTACTATTANISSVLNLTPLAATPSVTTGSVWVRASDGAILAYDGTTNNVLSD